MKKYWALSLFVINIFWYAIHQFQKQKCDCNKVLFIFKNISFSSSEPIPQLQRTNHSLEDFKSADVKQHTTISCQSARKYYCLDNSCKRQNIVMSVLRSKYILGQFHSKRLFRRMQNDSITEELTITSFNFLKCYFVCFSCHETRK